MAQQGNANEVSGTIPGQNNETALTEEERVNFDWLHMSDGEDESFEVDPDNIDKRIRYGKLKKTGETVAVAPRYYQWDSVFPELDNLVKKFEVIKKELESLLEGDQWTPWPEERLYNGPAQNGEWNVIPLLYTFPAYDETSSKWVSSNTNLIPETTKILKSIPNIRTALFSRIGPSTRLSQHQGWADLANYVLRCHLPIIVPRAKSDLCGMYRTPG